MVYVDDPIWPFGRMKMCHMWADTRRELLDMIDKIGVQRKWIQKPDTTGEHYDISKAKREYAIKLGATPVSWRAYPNAIAARNVDGWRERYFGIS